VLLTRTIAILPTFLVAKFQNIQDLSGMNDLLNALMSLQLPFAILPVISMTSSEHIMGEFQNGRYSLNIQSSKQFDVHFDNILFMGFTRIIRGISCTLAAVVIGINMYFVGYYMTGELPKGWITILAVTIFGILYLAFCAYLVMHMLVSMGYTWFDRYQVRLMLPSSSELFMNAKNARPESCHNMLTTST